MTLVSESDALHARVREYARRALGSSAAVSSSHDFEEIALDIARFQQSYVPGFARLVELHGASLSDYSAIPAVPVEVFRLMRVAVHPPELDAARFQTSGTTSAAPGIHALRTLSTYRDLALTFGFRALASAWPGPRIVAALAERPEAVPTSSLAFMMRAFMEAWDGRSFDDAPFDPNAAEHWLLGPSGVDIAGLERAAWTARRRNEPLVVLATAFALVHLLDVLGETRVVAPSRTVVMQTGGFKGRTREIAAPELIDRVARAFAIDSRQIVGEYGMTELSSQLYEGTLPGGALCGPRGVFVEPPWLRVTPIDPETLGPVGNGEPGVARITDLANVDSAVVILTQDLVRRRPGGIELLGRQSSAPPRGCSLAVEALVAGASGEAS